VAGNDDDDEVDDDVVDVSGEVVLVAAVLGALLVWCGCWWCMAAGE